MIRLLPIFIFGVVVGGLAMWVFLSLIRANRRIDDGSGVDSNNDVVGGKTQGLIDRQAEEKKRNKEQILGLLDDQHPLTNNHVEQLLGISDATATRYLEELEREGKIRQVGDVGKGVFYEKVN